MQTGIAAQLPDIFKSKSRLSAEQGRDATALMSAQERANTLPSDHGIAVRWKEDSKQFSKSSGRLIAICTLFGLLGLWGLVVFLTAISPPARVVQSTLTRPQADKNLYLLLAGSKPDVNTCKTILSASVLHWPTPRFITWDEKLNANERAREKSKKIVKFLDGFWKDEYDNDTVIILGEEANTWFQLRPEVFFHRFYELQAQANERLEKGLEQNVLFSVKGECPTYSSNISACLDAPSGDSNDQPWQKLDPRLLIGSVGNVKYLYKKALKRLEDSKDDESTVLNAIYQEQQKARAALRKATGKGSRKGSVKSRDDKDKKKDKHENDYSIGLDVGGELSHTVSAGVDNASWIRYDTQFQSGRKGSHARPTPLDEVITGSMPPFWTVSGQSEAKDQGWGDVDLLTNNIIPNIPPLIQFDQETEFKASPDRRKEWWEKLWLVPYGRELFTAFMDIPSFPIAITVDSQGVEHRVWDGSFKKAGLEVPKGDPDFLPWDKICNDAEVTKEVFRDDLGAWSHDYDN